MKSERKNRACDMVGGQQTTTCGILSQWLLSILSPIPAIDSIFDRRPNWGSKCRFVFGGFPSLPMGNPIHMHTSRKANTLDYPFKRPCLKVLLLITDRVILGFATLLPSHCPAVFQLIYGSSAQVEHLRLSSTRSSRFR